VRLVRRLSALAVAVGLLGAVQWATRGRWLVAVLLILVSVQLTALYLCGR
jgi:hypothetical protein